jgi:hypothetical protein
VCQGKHAESAVSVPAFEPYLLKSAVRYEPQPVHFPGGGINENPKPLPQIKKGTECIQTAGISRGSWLTPLFN